MFSDDDGGNDKKENDDIDDGDTTVVKMIIATDVAGLTTATGNVTFLRRCHCACTTRCDMRLS